MATEKVVKLNSDTHTSDLELLDQVMEEKSLQSRKEAREDHFWKADKWVTTQPRFEELVAALSFFLR